MAQAIGTARIRHADTGEVYEVEASDLEFDILGFEDRAMGPEYTHEASFEHPELGELHWMVFEYPMGAENHREVDVGRHRLLSDFDIDFTGNSYEDDEQHITAEERQRRIDEMVEWFFENFEDPAHRLPYITREGGYQWIYGGPYHAQEELADNFSAEREDIIQAAVDEIQSDGTFDWAPKEKPSDYGEDEDFGGIDEPDLRAHIEALPRVAPDYTFAVGDDDRIQVVFDVPPRLERASSELLAELREVAAALAASLEGSNAHPELLQIAESYRDAVSAEALSIAIVYARGSRLENAARSTRRRIEADEVPDLSAATDERLASTLEIHGAFVASVPEGRELLDAASAYRQPENELIEMREAAEQISEAINAAPHLFAQDARELIAEALTEAGTGAHPSRSSQVAANAVGQLTTVILTWTIGSVVSEGLVASMPGTMGAEAVTAGIDSAWIWLTANLASITDFIGAFAADVAWANRLNGVLQQVRAKLDMG